jgi:hypothetical protein
LTAAIHQRNALLRAICCVMSFSLRGDPKTVQIVAAIIIAART